MYIVLIYGDTCTAELTEKRNRYFFLLLGLSWGLESLKQAGCELPLPSAHSLLRRRGLCPQTRAALATGREKTGLTSQEFHLSVHNLNWFGINLV